MRLTKIFFLDIKWLSATDKRVLDVILREGSSKGRIKNRKQSEKYGALADDYVNEFVNISSKKWKKLVGNEYRESLERLAKQEIILINEHYSKGRFSKSYKIRDEILENYPIVEKEVYIGCRTWRYRRKMTELDIYRERQALALDEYVQIVPKKEGPWLRVGMTRREWQCTETRKRVTMASGWRRQLEAHYQRAWKRAKGKERVRLTVRHAVAATCGNHIEDGTGWMTECVAGRIHWAFSNLPKEARHFVRLDGKPLVGIDLKNSHPGIRSDLMTSWVEMAIEDREEAIRRIAKFLHFSDNVLVKKQDRVKFCTEEERQRKIAEIHSQTKSSFKRKERSKQYQTRDSYAKRLLERATEIVDLLIEGQEGIQEYADDAAAGRTYEKILPFVQQWIPEATRKDVKTAVLSIENERVKPEEEITKKAFRGLFKVGNIKDLVRLEYVCKYRVMHELQNLVKEQCHKGWAIQIQRIEANLVCSQENMKEAITLHDCLYTTENNLEKVRGKLERQIAERGLKVRLETEEVKPSSVFEKDMREWREENRIKWRNQVRQEQEAVLKTWSGISKIPSREITLQTNTLVCKHEQPQTWVLAPMWTQNNLDTKQHILTDCPRKASVASGLAYSRGPPAGFSQ